MNGSSHTSWPSIGSFWRNVFLGLLKRSLAHFLDWVFVALVIELHEVFDILETKPLWVTSFANIVSKSVSCLFVLLMVSFAVQKFMSLIRSTCLFLLLFLLLWETGLGKYWYDLCQRSPPDFYYRLFNLIS